MSEATKKKSIMSGLERFQIVIGIIITITTTVIGWQTFTLSERATENTNQLKAIEQQLAETRFGFERIRDIYDRTEKYLSSSEQNESRGRVLVVLINSLPESPLRSELLAVVVESAKSRVVAAQAASLRSTSSPPYSIANAPVLTSPPAEPRKATFVGNLTLALNDKYEATTLDDFKFIDGKGVEWPVPKGTIVSGSSIPRVAWSLIGGPLEGEFRIPSVLHEYYSTAQTKTPDEVNKMFYEAMLASGSSEQKAKVIYSAVVAFGPRWSVRR